MIMKYTKMQTKFKHQLNMKYHITNDIYYDTTNIDVRLTDCIKKQC